MLAMTRHSNLVKYLVYVILICGGFFIPHAHAQNLVLRDTTLTETQSFSAGSITAGPNVTISETGEVALTTNTLAIKPRFFIIRGGKLQVVTGSPAVSLETEAPVLPSDFDVSQNYPNPFNPATRIRYSLPTAGKTEVAVYNVFGRKVRTLISEEQGAGHHSVLWDGRDDAGESVSSGIYFYRVTADKYSMTKKMTLLK